MKLLTKEHYEVPEFKEITEVSNKEVLLVKVKELIKITYLKDIIRNVLIKSGIGIRNRVDVGEDNWLGKTEVYGNTLVILRTNSGLTPKDIENINFKLNELSLINIIEIEAHESYKVNEFRNIVEKYDRVLYRLTLDVKDEIIYSMSESNGGWKQKVLQWNGEIEEERVDGVVRVKVDKVPNTESNVYKVIIDAPYGLDVYRMIEQEFSLKNGSLEGYPIEGVLVYESVDEKKHLLGRKKCPIFNTSIERTVGGLVGDLSIRGMLGDKDIEVVKGKIKNR